MQRRLTILLMTMMVVVLSRVLPAEETKKGALGQDRGVRGVRGVQLLRAADTNRDGMLSQEEALNAVRRCFERTDTNKDGQLDEAELTRAVEGVDEMLKRSIAAVAKVKQDIVFGRWQRFAAVDADHDGKLSKAEAPGLLKQHFDRVDANSDGLIEKAELKRAIDAWAQRQKK